MRASNASLRRKLPKRLSHSRWAPHFPRRRSEPRQSGAADRLRGDVVDECGDDSDTEADNGEPNEDLLSEDEGDECAVDKCEGGQKGNDEGEAAKTEFCNIAGVSKRMHFRGVGYVLCLSNVASIFKKKMHIQCKYLFL